MARRRRKSGRGRKVGAAARHCKGKTIGKYKACVKKYLRKGRKSRR